MKRRHTLILLVLPVPLLAVLLTGVFLIGRDVQRTQRSRDLVASIARRDFDRAITLVNEGADCNRTLVYGETPTVWQRIQNLFRRSSRSGTQSNFPSPLAYAAEEELHARHKGDKPDRRWGDLLRVMLAHGGNPNSIVTQGYTPLFYAIGADDLEVANLLIQHGAEVNAQARYGNTPLMATHSLPMMRLLLRHGADCNIRDHYQNRALDYVYKPLPSQPSRHLPFHPEIVACLLDAGSACNSQNDQGNTILHFAASRGDVDTVRLLLARGARTDIKNKAGRTPLDSLHRNKVLLHTYPQRYSETERLLLANSVSPKPIR